VLIAIQVISSHPVLTRAVNEILSRPTDFSARILPPASDEAEVKKSPSLARLFLLDACSLQTDLGPLAGRLRAHSPGSKFLALLSPASSNDAEKTRLFYWGIDGFVDLHKTWKTELPLAIRSLLEGQVWVPPNVLATYVKQVRALLQAQLLPGHSLTAREAQVLQLLMRSLTNKEISVALRISERTAKFHVSNILTKLNLEDRHGVLPDRFRLSELLPDA
jgi:DNA-binding NarL/FixJ family response regulator